MIMKNKEQILKIISNIQKDLLYGNYFYLKHDRLLLDKYYKLLHKK